MEVDNRDLPKRMLGRTGIEVTQLGYGSMGLRGPRTWGVRVVEEADAERFLNRVLDEGINFIDTSPDYGIAEERIGRYLSHRRDAFTLATKCGCVTTQHADNSEIDHHWDADVIRGNLETSLRRLQTDVIDVLQFHGGDAETLERAGLLELLSDFRRQGLIRWIGISTKLPNVEALVQCDVFDTFQLPYSCLAPEHDAAMQAAADAGAGVIVRGGVAQGGPEAEIQRPALNAVWEAADLEGILPAGMSRAQFLLRMTLSHPACQTTIVGTCNPAHLQENLAAARAGALPADLVAEVQSRVARALQQGKVSR